LKHSRKIDCQLKIANLTEDIRGIFEICRLETIFKIYDTVDEALSQ